MIAGYTLSDKGIPFSSLDSRVLREGQTDLRRAARTGFTNAMRVELKKMLDRLVRPTKPFEQIPKDPDLRRAVWAEPKLVGEVAHFSEWTDEGVIRHPSFQGLREDKKPMTSSVKIHPNPRFHPWLKRGDRNLFSELGIKKLLFISQSIPTKQQQRRSFRRPLDQRRHFP